MADGYGKYKGGNDDSMYAGGYKEARNANRMDSDFLKEQEVQPFKNDFQDFGAKAFNFNKPNIAAQMREKKLYEGPSHNEKQATGIHNPKYVFPWKP